MTGYWENVIGCTVDGDNCLLSPNFPRNYGVIQCSTTFGPDWIDKEMYMHATKFHTVAPYDILEMRLCKPEDTTQCKNEEFTGTPAQRNAPDEERTGKEYRPLRGEQATFAPTDTTIEVPGFK